MTESSKTAGIYHKYDVERADGKEDGIDALYFVLRMSSGRKGPDPHAIPALRAYADSCEDEYPYLARDLRGQAKRMEVWLKIDRGEVGLDVELPHERDQR